MLRSNARSATICYLHLKISPALLRTLLYKRQLTIILFGVCLTLLCSSWGFFAHYRINRLAVFTLPKAMAGFYKSNIEFITEHAISADKKRYVDSTEAPRHFLDADHYGKNPINRITQSWSDAVE